MLTSIQEGDDPKARRQAAFYLKRGEYARALECLERKADASEIKKQVVDLAERQATLQARANEVMLRSEATLTVRQTYELLTGIIRIVVGLAGKTLGRRIISEIYRQLMHANPKIALAAANAEEGDGAGLLDGGLLVEVEADPEPCRPLNR